MQHRKVNLKHVFKAHCTNFHIIFTWGKRAHEKYIRSCGTCARGDKHFTCFRTVGNWWPRSMNYAEILFKNKNSLGYFWHLFFFNSKLGHPNLGAQATRVRTLHMKLLILRLTTWFKWRSFVEHLSFQLGKYQEGTCQLEGCDTNSGWFSAVPTLNLCGTHSPPTKQTALLVAVTNLQGSLQLFGRPEEAPYKLIYSCATVKIYTLNAV
jgi:hypothetical protein